MSTKELRRPPTSISSCLILNISRFLSLYGTNLEFCMLCSHISLYLFLILLRFPENSEIKSRHVPPSLSLPLTADFIWLINALLTHFDNHYTFCTDNYMAYRISLISPRETNIFSQSNYARSNRGRELIKGAPYYFSHNVSI